jgi:hypothetical protein
MLVPQAEAAPAAQRFKEIGDLNDFEKKLLEEVWSFTTGVWLHSQWVV